MHGLFHMIMVLTQVPCCFLGSNYLKTLQTMPYIVYFKLNRYSRVVTKSIRHLWQKII